MWSWASPTLMVPRTAALDLGMAADYMGDGKEVLSDGGTTITWTIPTMTKTILVEE